MPEETHEGDKTNYSIHTKCPNCGNRTIDTKGVLSRRAICDTCGGEFDTSEVHRPMFFGEDSMIDSDSSLDFLEQTKEDVGEEINERVEKQKERRREVENANTKELSEDEIQERINRIKLQSGPTVGSSLVMIGVGIVLSITVVGAIIGIPLIIIGVFGLIGVPLQSLVNFGDNTVRGSPWAGTSLKGPDMREHRKVNESFEYRCPNCGTFVSLRNLPDKPNKTVQCDECDVMYERELGYGRGWEKPHWRLVKGESDLRGEINKVSEWQSIRREREIKSQ